MKTKIKKLGEVEANRLEVTDQIDVCSDGITEDKCIGYRISIRLLITSVLAM